MCDCENQDTVTFVDDNGVKLELEIVDYFLYDGQEYVILANMGGVEEGKSDDPVDVFIMQVNVIDEENEEFVHIDADKEDDVLEFAGKLLNGELPNEDEIL